MEETTALIENDKTNQDIKRQVYVIAETILHIAKGVEEALVNITAVKGVLSRITKKISQQELICDEERALLTFTEKWLNEEKIRSSKPENGKTGIGDVNLSQISALGTSFLSAAGTQNSRNTSGSYISTPLVSTQFSVGSTQTLNDDDELDWDGNGVELTESFHSTYSGAKTAFNKNPYNLCNANNLIDSDESENSDVVKSASYHGIYEEEMELTLEVEEGFYSDSSSSENAFNDVINDFSPQTDSGVTHLDSNTSTERSISHPGIDDILPADRTPPEDDLTMEALPCYNREINTWDMYGTVNLEEDLSTASSANNSNNSTPRFIRKQAPSSSVTQQECTQTQCSKITVNSVSSTVEHTLASAKTYNSINNHDLQTPAKSRSRASSVSENNMSSPKLTPERKMTVSSPLLSQLVTYPAVPQPASSPTITQPITSPTLTHLVSANCDDEMTNGGSETSSSPTSSKLSIGTSILVDGYLKSSHSDLQDDLSLPESIRKNNYKPKSRRAVFV